MYGFKVAADKLGLALPCYAELFVLFLFRGCGSLFLAASGLVGYIFSIFFFFLLV